MAGSNYTLLVQAQIDPSKIQAQLNAFSDNKVVNIRLQMSGDALAKFDTELEKIKEKATSIGKISLSKDSTGAATRAMVEYTDQTGQAVKAVITLNSSIGTVETSTKNLAKDANEMYRAYMNAEKFLAKSTNMARTPQVGAAIAKAEEIRVAVNEGDLAKVRKLNQEFTIMKSGLSGVKEGIKSWSSQMGEAIRHTIQYATSIGLVYGAMNQIKQGIQYITDLNTEMTKIQVLQIDGAKSNEEISNLAVQYNILAKEVGSTTTEVAKGSVEWLRQGKSIAETQELLKSTMYLSKLGNLDTAQSTEYLTAILNGFQLKTEDAITVVNKLIAIDNIAATSAGELATAMQYSSAIANETGISFDNLAAMIGAVSSNTRLSAEMIGQAFKTMAVRMQSVKAGEIDETGMSLNNVEKTLANVGIALRDSKDSFRPLEDVIKDVAGVWGNLNEVQKQQISNAIAGQRQAQIFTSLMQNWGDVTKYVTAETNSLGLAEKNYAIYLESIEAKQNALKASWEKLVGGAATAEFVGSFYDGAKWIMDTVDALGGIPTILKVLIPLLVAFNVEWLTTQRLALGTMLQSIWSGLSNLGTILLTSVNPAMAETMILETGVAAGLDTIAVSQATVTLGLTALIALLIGAVKAYKELRVAQEESRKTATELNNDAIKNSSSYAEYIEKTKAALTEQGYMIDENGRAYTKGARGLRDYNSGIELMSELNYNAIKSTDDFDRKQEELGNTLQENSDFIEEAKQAYQSLGETMGSLTETADSLKSIMSDADANGGAIDFSKIDELAKIYPDYLNALTVENGQLKLNTDMVRAYISAKADQAVADAKAAGASEEEIAILKEYASQLNEQQNIMIGTMNLTAQTANQVFWNIANEAALSGNSFVDLQGKALTSAESIFKFLSSGDQAFNSFVQQAAQITGRSVTEIMNMVNAMVVQSANNSIQAINTVAAATSGMSYSQSAVATTASLFASPQIKPLGLFVPAAPSYGGGGSGGGGSSAEDKAAKKKAEQEAKRKKIQDQVDKAQKDAENSLKKQLDSYKDIIDARKDLLDSMKEERSYQRDIEDQNKKILNIQNELATLQLDNSASAQARILELQNELETAQRDLEDTQYNHSIDQQKAALDADYKAFEDKINSANNAVQGISATSMSEFSRKLSEILSTIGTTSTFHDGAERGVVGGNGLKSGELFAKLMKGEVVTNAPQMENFMNKTLPAMTQFSSSTNNKGGDLNVEMPVQFFGNVDKSMLPQIENMIEKAVRKLNDNLITRGWNRRADQFGL